MDVSIIIVNYNTKELTRNCLKSVFEQTKSISFEVIISDNSSKDGSIEMIKSEFPQVILIENNANLGFGAANNRGLKVAKGKYIFYLNSDTVLLNNAVKIFFDYWENSPEKEKIGVLGCNLSDNKGNCVHSWGNFPTYKSIFKSLIYCFSVSYGMKRIWKFFFRKIGIIEPFYGNVEYITGADNFLLNNSDAFFDERYFMYFEESDLQLKLRHKGKSSILIHGPKIIHFEGASSKDKNENSMNYDFRKKSVVLYWASCCKYAEKNLLNEKKLQSLKNFLLFIYSLKKNKKSKSLFLEALK
ncbi:glycosyltransferase family 2 protein [Treponema sp.]|uniref:glycosyltransferase family 2 protein n=2 Tax=Treponema TaxID=157 RepID=UPI00257EE91F|nr:glycosyltransferase family 2 protein [Treponema sp.]